MKTCPKCNKKNEDNIITCECGYDFRENVAQKLSKWTRFFHYHQLNAKYSALFVIALIFDIFAIISLIFIIFGVIRGFHSASFMMVISAILFGVLSYLVLKAFSETIILFIGIEENTSKTNDILEKILENSKK